MRHFSPFVHYFGGNGISTASVSRCALLQKAFSRLNLSTRFDVLEKVHLCLPEISVGAYRRALCVWWTTAGFPLTRGKRVSFY